jgi:hypothetical protein
MNPRARRVGMLIAVFVRTKLKGPCMHHVLDPMLFSSADRYPQQRWHEPVAVAPPSALLRRPDPLFDAMCSAYRDHGGLVLAQDAWANCPPDTARLARCMVEHRVVHFYWSADTWLPLFQFNRSDMSVKPGVQLVLSELKNAYDSWEVAQWFVSPHTELAGRMPVAVFESDPQSVAQAARMDRYLANG